MLRLLQGDVGSGKTAVAAYALAATARAGLQGALLAPTDLLARQHLETVGALLEGVGIGVTLLTGSLKADVKAKALEAIASGQALVVVGTHALIQDAVSFADLGLVVIDEQHRFGVDQRGPLEAKAGGRSPHVLLMTATPIPRTLGQVLYADLDVSDLRTPPAGRVQIRTGIRKPADLDGTWRKVREEAAAGHRTFVVVPLIEEGVDDGDGAVAAESEAVRLAAAPRSAPGRDGPRPAEGGRARRRDDPLPRRRARRARRHDRRRGRRRRAGGDDDGHRGRRPVRAGPAPPAARPGRPRDGRVVLRPRLRLDRRDRRRRACAPSSRRTTGSRSPRRTSSCARRATSWASPRAASRACGSPRSRSPSIASWPFARGLTPRRSSTRPDGWIRPDRRCRPSSRTAGCGASPPAKPASGT